MQHPPYVEVTAEWNQEAPNIEPPLEPALEWVREREAGKGKIR
jgi:hypothetical protein